VTSRPSGPHRGHEPSPTRAEPTRPLVGDPPGPAPHGHRGHEPSPTRAEPTPALVAEASGPHSSDRALLRVVRGEPSAEELAALTVVVASLSRQGRQGRPRRRPVPVGAWASPGDAHRPVLRPGPGGWRAAGRFG
jgi:hypothetical protein